jgi:uncharacterized protein YuzE
MMKITYDLEADAFYARFAPEETAIANTTEVAPNVMLDLDARGELVGIEVLGVAVRLRAGEAENLKAKRKAAAE